MFIRLVTLTVVAIVGWFGMTAADEGPGGIRAADLREHVVFLSSDEMSGREAGQAGARRAEDYIAAQFTMYGLRPLPGRDQLHVDLDLYANDFDRTATALEFHGTEHRLIGEPGVDFRPFDFSAEGSVEGDVVFAGYGITAPENDYDDYAGLDVAGKIVLVLRHEPEETDPTSSFDGTDHTIHAQFRAKAQRAGENGAIGMILFTDPLHHRAGDDLRLGGRLSLDASPGSGPQGRADTERIPAVHVTREIAQRIVEPSGLTLEQVQRAVDAGRRPAEIDLGSARVAIQVTRAKQPIRVAARNVAGFVEGNDPELKEEWIIVGAHHDHIGGYEGEGDTIYNGADDNASGTAAVLGLARAFAARDPRPRRSILFVTFTAEEKGLLGSRALVDQGLIPIDHVKFMLNLDMIGRNPERPVQVFGDGYVRGLRPIVEAANERTGLSLRYSGAGYAANSDHHAFYARDIPFMFLFTGIHEDYHRVGDHADKLDYERMERIVRLTHDVLVEIAGADAPPRFVHNIAWLGMQIETEPSTGGNRARVTHVEAHSRAGASGLRTGDVLVAFDGRRLNGQPSIGEQFREIAPGSSFEVSVNRDGEERTIALERARTGYMGIGPGEVDDELRTKHALHADEGVLVNNVAPGGPSERAGLRSRDIILRMDGVPVSSSNLRSRLAQIGAGETVRLDVLRNGRRKSLLLRLGERPEEAS